jgi:hypothetical protein
VDADGRVLDAALVVERVCGTGGWGGCGSLWYRRGSGRRLRSDCSYGRGRRRRGNQYSGDFVEAPGAADAVVDDAVERGRNVEAWLECGLKCKGTQEQSGEVVYVALEKLLAVCGIVGVEDAGADAVRAELDGLAHGDDVGGVDLRVNEAAVVKRRNGWYEAGRDLHGLGDGEGTFFEEVGKVSVGRLHDRIG